MLFYDTLERDYRIHTGFYQRVVIEVCADFEDLKLTIKDCHIGDRETVEILPPDISISNGVLFVDFQAETTEELAGTYSYEITGFLNGDRVLIVTGKLFFV